MDIQCRSSVYVMVLFEIDARNRSLLWCQIKTQRTTWKAWILLYKVSSYTPHKGFYCRLALFPSTPVKMSDSWQGSNLPELRRKEGFFSDLQYRTAWEWKSTLEQSAPSALHRFSVRLRRSCNFLTVHSLQGFAFLFTFNVNAYKRKLLNFTLSNTLHAGVWCCGYGSSQPVVLHSLNAAPSTAVAVRRV